MINKLALAAVAMLALTTSAVAAPSALQQDIDRFEKLHFDCVYGPPDAPEEIMKKACDAAGALEEKLEARGYCVYGHGVVGRSSKDKKHCYTIKVKGN